MIINSFSAFYYGHRVTNNNFIIPFNEGAGTINAEVSIGAYTLSSFTQAVASALNEFGQNEYQVTVDRVTRIITISSDQPFNLLFGSSLDVELSLYDLLGFSLVDTGFANSHSGNNASGFAYYPQFKLQNFQDFEMIRRANAPTVRTSASGRVEVVKYSSNNFMRCDIPFITNIIGQGVIKNNPNGVQDAIAFMNYATDKLDLEFIYDVNDVNNFVPCILESTQSAQDGTSFELVPLYSRGLTGYFELPQLLFRRID